MRIAGIVLYVLICCLAGIHGGPTDLSGYSITPHYGKSGEWEGYDIAKKDAGELLCKDDFLWLLQSRFHLGQHIRTNYWLMVSHYEDFSTIYERALVVLEMQHEHQPCDAKVVDGVIRFLIPMPCANPRIRSTPGERRGRIVLLPPDYQLICAGQAYGIGDLDKEAFDSNHYRILRTLDGTVVIVAHEPITGR